MTRGAPPLSARTAAGGGHAPPWGGAGPDGVTGTVDAWGGVAANARASLSNGSRRSSAGHVPTAIPSTVVPTGSCESQSAVSMLLNSTWVRGVRTQCSGHAGAASPGSYGGGRARLRPAEDERHAKGTPRALGSHAGARSATVGATVLDAPLSVARSVVRARVGSVPPSGLRGRVARCALERFAALRNPGGVSQLPRMPGRCPRTENVHWRDS